MKNWFSNCFPLLYICLHCDEVCICWYFGAPATPGFYVRAQHEPENVLFNFFILTQKVLIIMLLYLTCKLLLKSGKCEPRWAQSDYWSPPPPPPGSQIAKDVNVFHIWKTYYPSLFHVVHTVSNVMRSSWHFSTSRFNIHFSRTPQKWKQNYEKCLSDYFHIICCWEDSFGVKSIYKCLWGLVNK